MIYIIGSSGYIGQKLNLFFKKKKIVNITSKKNKKFITTNIFRKISSEKWIKKISKNDIIFLLSSFGSIEYHEKNKKIIDAKINNLNNNFFKKVDTKSKIIFFSSDMVYGNTRNVINDSTKTRPLNNYGKTKIKIENLIKKNFKYYLILRLPKIFSESTKENIFPNTHLQDLKNMKTIKLYKDNLYHYMDIKYFKKIISNKIIFEKNLTGTYNLPVSNSYSRIKFLEKFLGVKKYNKCKHLIKENLLSKSKIKFPKKLIMKTNFYKKINLI
jgi:dTDP-4-dehydrorhamnose reductase